MTVQPTSTLTGELQTFPPSPVCAECGGECCSTMPGCAYPQDFPGGVPTQELLRERLLTKDWVFDYWESEGHLDDAGNWVTRTPQLYYLRPAVRVSESRFHTPHWPVDPSWGGCCVFLSSEGCTCSQKPLGCKLLEPHAGGKCEYHLGMPAKLHAGLAWEPYQHIIWELIEELS